MKLFLVWTSGSVERLKHFLYRALAAPLFGGMEPFVQFG